MRLFFVFLLVRVLPIAAQEKCLPCHRAEVQAFARSGMGRSISPIQPPGAAVRIAASQIILTVLEKRGRPVHRVERGGVTAEHAIDIAIGSGNVGRSFGVRIGDSLFQSPISWYSQTSRWDLSPGYDRRSTLDFDRRITMECLYCHAGAMRKVSDPPHSITCERCHAPGGDHYGNPAKLAREARDSVCEQCHLQGEARILNPGNTWGDAQPAFTTYVSSNPSGSLKVVSQVEQLALSRCAQQSGGKLWCGTCHSPHGPDKDQKQVCLSCHGGAIPASHTDQMTDCAGCHMPRQPLAEVAHTVYTDHRIRKNAIDSAATAAAPGLIPWREPAPAYRDRNLGLADVYAGQRNQLVDLVQKGFQELIALKDKDAEVLSAIGSVLLQKRRPAEAAEMFAKAAAMEPGNSGYEHNHGVALMSLGDNQGAIAKLERAIKLDPLDEQAHSLLEQIYTSAGQDGKARDTIARYLKVNPQSIAFRLRNRKPVSKTYNSKPAGALAPEIKENVLFHYIYLPRTSIVGFVKR